MAKTIQTGLPDIGKKERFFQTLIPIELKREDIEGASFEHIIKLVENQAKAKINNFIARAKNQADQWAAETAAEERFLKNDQ